MDQSPNSFTQYGNSKEPQIINLKKEYGSIISGSSSESHSVIILEKNISLAIGDNSKLQLGIGSTESTVNEFTPVKLEQNFKSVACGQDFTVWLTTEDKLFGSGLLFTQNNIPTQIENLTAKYIASYNKSFAIISDDSSVIYWPDLSNFSSTITQHFDSEPKTVSIGNGFVSVLLENHTAFIIKEDRNISPIIVPSIALKGGNLFNEVKSCANYTAVITMQKEVNIFGTLGEYHQKRSSIPIFDDEPLHVFTFPDYCIIIDTDFRTYSFGKNDFGQMAISGVDRCYQAIATEYKFPVKEVFGSSKSSFFVPLILNRDLVKYDPEDLIKKKKNDDLSLTIEHGNHRK
ncbi:protein RCC2 [Histomonas meleagridis]|uniref:protein RCC2-like n=1 Tax=Histomonas meleagridis TaxID=135588 RepID=UPI003559625D|nr:protein RCC2 [Histomonas meleagridis]KAH0798632.1 protein RCC2-like [Histomonas meleagridis]